MITDPYDPDTEAALRTTARALFGPATEDDDTPAPPYDDAEAERTWVRALFANTTDKETTE